MRAALLAGALALLAAVSVIAAPLSRPDLTVAFVTVAPLQVAPGGTITARDVTRNRGSRRSGKSVTAYLLSLDARRGAGDVRLGRRSVGALTPKRRAAGSRRLTVPAGTPAGNYRLLACADDTRRVRERSERNNCRASAKLLRVVAPAPPPPPPPPPPPVMRTLDVVRAGLGSGAVTSAPAGIDCGSDCSESYAHGTGVVLTAAAGAGSSFEGWDGACAGTTGPTCTVTLEGARSAVARFEPLPPTLSVMRAGTGSGSVTSAPAGISCGSVCSAAFGVGQSVTLTASPAIGSHFTGWSGACSGAGRSCNVQMAHARAVTATFEVSRQLSAEVTTGDTSGAILGLDVGLDCPGDCIVGVPHGQDVTLEAAPSEGFEFAGWGEACAAQDGPVCTVSMTEARHVTGAFRPVARQLTVTRTGSGKVTGTGIDCGTDCTESYVHGAQVTLTATPAAGASFTGWSGAPHCTGTVCTVTMDAAKTVSAAFTTVHTLTVVKDDGGTVSGPGIDCGADCSETYAAGTSVVLTFNPTSGWNWMAPSGCTPGPAPNQCTVLMDRDRTLRDYFRGAVIGVELIYGEGTGGTLSSSPAGLACIRYAASAQCRGEFGHDTPVTLTPLPGDGSLFRWSGGICTGSDGPCTIRAGVNSSGLSGTFIFSGAK